MITFLEWQSIVGRDYCMAHGYYSEGWAAAYDGRNENGFKSSTLVFHCVYISTTTVYNFFGCSSSLIKVYGGRRQEVVCANVWAAFREPYQETGRHKGLLNTRT